ncbi:MAG: MFS transporter [Gammaproteobacteria bacterium]|nr:MAG: MFS transporter [Gammaproteobacteria bacterium]
MSINQRADDKTGKAPEVGGRYAHYVLFVLILVYIFNFVDRNILSILAEDIKADLGISDAQMGFLYGTVFAVFYAVFGIPLARFADVWNRRSLISLGLLIWSGMTVLSGTAKSFFGLATYRVGVGIGEASASPAAYSILADYYPPQIRAFVIALYSSGVYIGGGLGLAVGGWVVDAWATAYPESPPLGLKGWQVAFFVVGAPGILLAAWVRSLREPIRGMSEGLVTKPHPAPWKVLYEELVSVLPGLSFAYLARVQAGVLRNLTSLVLVGLGVYLLAALTGSIGQWVVLGIGVYITLTWAQLLKKRDAATYHMLFGSKALIYSVLAFPTISFVSYGVGFWVAPYLLREFGASPGDIGFYIGLGNAVAGLMGVSIGGYLADRWKLKYANGRLYVVFIGVGLTIPSVLMMLYTDSIAVALWMNFVYHIPITMFVGIPPATTSDLVVPRMRAVAGAFYLLMNTLIGLALGPYFIGQMSDLFAEAGRDGADALRLAMLSALGIFALTIVFVLLAMRHLPRDEATRLERAKALGEDFVKASEDR